MGSSKELYNRLNENSNLIKIPNRNKIMKERVFNILPVGLSFFYVLNHISKNKTIGTKANTNTPIQ
jgi:hypothetical protein